MLGKIRKKMIAVDLGPIKKVETFVCPVCERAIPKTQMDAHHLIPKSKGGKATEYLHRICHRQIHALFSETELARALNTAEAIREHPDMQNFIKWVKSKPDGFYQRTSKSDRIRKLT
ncbi:HNH endonuclease [Polynucleobacter paludilacus]|uniref:HNH endonuclease n=1 Tax=Polynucleobacter paludilacus TaxID=1855895 RepID=UPI001BFEC259|nr:HNH endonuclease signature motif containing protein [Polynucleobacter paludilacus]QWD87391.1 HNH endonuclease [Polynucleobacter paludilacus]